MKERFPQERRVSLLRAESKTLAGFGATVTSNGNAGAQSYFTDQEYQEAGAAIVYSPEELIMRSDCGLGKLLLPTLDELSMLREGQTLFAAVPSCNLKKQIIEKTLGKKSGLPSHNELIRKRTGGNCRLYRRWRKLQDKLSIQVAAHFLQTRHGGRGVLSAVSRSSSGHVVILGAGTGRKNCSPW